MFLRNLLRSGSLFFSVNETPMAPLLVRLIVGCVFLSEGIQKFLFSDSLGVGRFIKIGIPAPEIMAPFVGIVEIVCGTLVLVGFFTRLAAIPLIFNMLVAIAATKVPIFLERGFWAMAHESRTDWSMLLASLFLALVGAGRWSVDGMKSLKKPTVTESWISLIHSLLYRRILSQHLTGK